MSSSRSASSPAPKPPSRASYSTGRGASGGSAGGGGSLGNGGLFSCRRSTALILIAVMGLFHAPEAIISARDSAKHVWSTVGKRALRAVARAAAAAAAAADDDATKDPRVVAAAESLALSMTARGVGDGGGGGDRDDDEGQGGRAGQVPRRDGPAARAAARVAAGRRGGRSSGRAAAAAASSSSFRAALGGAELDEADTGAGAEPRPAEGDGDGDGEDASAWGALEPTPRRVGGGGVLRGASVAAVAEAVDAPVVRPVRPPTPSPTAAETPTETPSAPPTTTPATPQSATPTPSRYPSSSAPPLMYSNPRPAIPRATAAMLETDAQVRLNYWSQCLASAALESCRPETNAAAAPLLSKEEWKRHTLDVLRATAPLRALPRSAAVDGGDTSADPSAPRGPPPLELAMMRHYLGDADGVERGDSGDETTGAVGDGMGGLTAETWARLWQFYPLVPIFAQWSDAAFPSPVGPGGELSPNATAARAAALHVFDRAGLQLSVAVGGSPLRTDVLYATFSHHARGEPGGGTLCSQYRNVVVFSAGGWGDVALPLVAGEPQAHVSTDPLVMPLGARWQSFPRSRAFVFMPANRPGAAPPAALEDMARAVRESSLPDGNTAFFWAPRLRTPTDWRDAALRALFVLVPRGVGRASSRVYELLQYGRVPVVLYDDEPWLPYQHVHDFAAPGSLPERYTDAGPLDSRRVGAVQQCSASARHDSPWRCNRPSSAHDLPLDRAEAAEFMLRPRRKAGLSGPGKRAVPVEEVETTILNDGGMWGPGGVGLAVPTAQVAGFLCMACELVEPGSALRYRHVRTLRFDGLGTRTEPDPEPAAVSRAHAGLGLARRRRGGELLSPSPEPRVPDLCPCTADRWEATLAGLHTRGVGAVASDDENGKRWLLPQDSLLAEMERRGRAVAARYFTTEAVAAHVADFLGSPLTSELVCAPKPRVYGTLPKDSPPIEV